MSKEEDAIKHIENIMPYVGENIKESLNMAIKSLKQEIKMGRWVIVDDEYGDNSICECSECKDRVWMYKSADQKWNYCPNCGLRMESEVQNDRTN
jgi:PHP family Zn ribbon phosphoesterase